jgi:uncharacterized membrane protein
MLQFSKEYMEDIMRRKREPKKPLSKKELLEMLLNHEQKEIEKMEEMVDLLISKNISINVNSERDEDNTFGERMSDKLANFAGSWTFIIIFIVVLTGWILLNLWLFTNPFDEYPFILLNLILSTIASVQAPIIMMSQNRQDKKDRIRSENDYKIDLKAELILEDLHNKLNEVLTNQEALKTKVNNLEKTLKPSEDNEQKL